MNKDKVILRLKEALSTALVTRVELAHLSGISTTTLNRIISGMTDPRVKTIAKVGKALDKVEAEINARLDAENSELPPAWSAATVSAQHTEIETGAAFAKRLAERRSHVGDLAADLQDALARTKAKAAADEQARSVVAPAIDTERILTEINEAQTLINLAMARLSRVRSLVS